MFEISFPELVLVCIVALLVLGPERLPEALRTAGLWFGRMRRSFLSVKSEIEREIGMDEVRRQLHNERILDDIKRLEREARGGGSGGAPAAMTANPAAGSPASTAPGGSSSGSSDPKPNGTAS